MAGQVFVVVQWVHGEPDSYMATSTKIYKELQRYALATLHRIGKCKYRDQQAGWSAFVTAGCACAFVARREIRAQTRRLQQVTKAQNHIGNQKGRPHETNHVIIY